MAHMQMRITGLSEDDVILTEGSVLCWDSTGSWLLLTEMRDWRHLWFPSAESSLHEVRSGTSGVKLIATSAQFITRCTLWIQPARYSINRRLIFSNPKWSSSSCALALSRNDLLRIRACAARC